jgi:tRNA nucleotidyltransferase (CCA-adding enzyme)
MKLFRRTVPIGVDHGTVGVLVGGTMYEVTTFRRDVETFGRHAVVAFADTVEEDLARRDFTINAMAWHPLTGELLDPFDGPATSPMVGSGPWARRERFAEDYLRVLRALRFAGRFGLEIEDDTWTALQATPWSTSIHCRPKGCGKSCEGADRAAVRRRGRWTCTAGGCPRCPLPRARRAPGEPPGASPDLWELTLGAVDAIPPHRTTLRLAALLHAIGMPPARTKDLRGGWRHTGHEVLGGRKAEDVMRRLKARTRSRARVRLVRRHQPTSSRPTPRTPWSGAGCVTWARTWCTTSSGSDSRSGARSRSGREDGGARTPDDLLERWAMAHRVLLEASPWATGDLAIGGRELRAWASRRDPGSARSSKGSSSA